MEHSGTILRLRRAAMSDRMLLAIGIGTVTVTGAGLLLLATMAWW